MNLDEDTRVLQERKGGRNVDPDKRQLRKLKRDVKRAGNKRKRAHLKRELRDNPEEAPFTTFDYGDTSSQTLNGLDEDATRRRDPEQEP